MEKHRKFFFIGSLSADPTESGAAQSIAGDQIQGEILGALESRGEVYSAFMMPLPAYPMSSKLFYAGIQNGGRHWLPFINLPIIKHVTFSIFLLSALIRSRPDDIIVYNSYFFQNIAIILYRHLISRRVRWCTLVQDILPVISGTRSLQRWLDRKSINFLKSCDLVAPVTQRIAEDFSLNKHIIVVPGGVTSVMRKMVYEADTSSRNKEINNEKKNFMFAGRLEAYNGIDRLIDTWEYQSIGATLHVFGDGSLRNHIEAASGRCSSIVYHGSVPHSVIINNYLTADGVIVLRYSHEIEAEYFFPSKYFEAIISPCAVITNKFPGLEEKLMAGCEIVKDNLEDLKIKVDSVIAGIDSEKISMRRDFIARHFSYDNQINEITTLLSKI